MTDSAAISRPHPSIALGALMVAASALLFSSKAVVVKCAYPLGVDVVTLLALRMGIALPIFLAVAWREERRAAAPLAAVDLARCVGLGVLGYYVASLLDFHGLRFIGVGLERMVLYIYPTIVVLVGAIVLRQRLGRTILIALAATYAGIGLIYAGQSAVGTEVGLGVALVAGSAIAYAFFILLSGPVIARLGSQRVMAIAMSGACVVVLLHKGCAWALGAGPPPVRLPAQVYGYGAILAILGTVAPSLLMGEGLKRVGSQRFVIISTIGPVGTVLLGWAVLGEVVSLLNVGGMALTVAASVAMGLSKARPAVISEPRSR